MKRISCGFLISSNGLYLLGHTTQADSHPFNPNESLWSIPKGMMNEGESEIDTAIRETLEETNIYLPDYYDVSNSELLMSITTKQKIIKVYSLVDIDNKLINIDCRCTSMINAPHMPLVHGKPELDMFIWANKLQAHRLVFNSLKPLFI